METRPRRLRRRTNPPPCARAIAVGAHSLAGKRHAFCRRVSSRGSRARQRAQLVATALEAQEAPLLVPGAEHDTLCRLAVDLDVVHPGTVRMTVYEAADARGAEGCRHRLGVHIHDVGHGARGVATAAGARLIREL